MDFEEGSHPKVTLWVTVIPYRQRILCKAANKGNFKSQLTTIEINSLWH